MDETPDELSPGEVADLPDRIIKALLDNQTRVRKLFRRWLVATTLVFGLGIGYVAWNSHHQTNTVDQIRASQVANTAKTDHHDQCNQTAYHDLGYDLMIVVRPGETPMQFLAQIKIPPAKC